MKKTLLALSLVGSTVLASSAMAADGTLTFTGAIDDATCVIGSGGGAIGTTDLTIGLDTFTTSALTASGQTVGDKKFSLNLEGPECQAGKIYKMGFLATANNVNTNGRLVNTAVQGATEVEIQLLDKSGTPIDLNDMSAGPESDAISAGNTGSIDMTARYYATNQVTEGPVNAEVEFVLSHN